MKFTCNKNDFSEGINIALKAVAGKSTIPTLECVAIETMDDKIKITANNMELGIETLVEGDITEKGSVLIHAKMLAEIVRKLPEDEVYFEADGENNIILKCGKANFNISGLGSEEFSFLPDVEKTKMITLSQFTLKEMIRQTIFSTSDNESNRILTGELFEINGNQLQVTSLDLYRVSIRKVELREEYEEVKVIIPGKTLSEISKILSGNIEDEVKVYFSNNHVLFEFENTIVLSRLIEGNYYDINKMISNDYETKVKINKMDLLGCIDRATLLLRESEKKPVVMTIEENSVHLEMNTKIGSMDESIGIEKEGKDIVFAFNPKFLIDVLRVIDDEDTYIYMINSKSPCFIKNKEESYIYMILPVNLSSSN